MTKVELALYHLRQAMQDDPGYAWAWHCNMACSIMDEGVSHDISNRAAARFMKLAFDVDTSKEPSDASVARN